MTDDRIPRLSPCGFDSAPWVLGVTFFAAAIWLTVVNTGDAQQTDDPAPTSGERDLRDAAEEPPTPPVIVRPEVVDAEKYPRLHNLIRVTPRIFSGSEPAGTEAFAQLRELGVTTVVSVDGARPDVETAREFGIRYVHIPIGYDGVQPEAAAALTRVAREIRGPIYLHCHHGKHRGPAAAAVCAMAGGNLDRSGAIQLLKLADTSPDYDGLWRAVMDFTPRPDGAELPELVEIARVDSLIEAMVRLGRKIDQLRDYEARRWAIDPQHPDVVPHRIALLMGEEMREAGRNLSEDYDGNFRLLMTRGEDAAMALSDALREGRSADAATHLAALRQSCTDCHRQYRD